jgi:hypothetical protein
MGYDDIVPTLFGNRYERGRYYMWRLRQAQRAAASAPVVQPPARPLPADGGGQEAPQSK